MMKIIRNVEMVTARHTKRNKEICCKDTVAARARSKTQLQSGNVKFQGSGFGGFLVAYWCNVGSGPARYFRERTITAANEPSREGLHSLRWSCLLNFPHTKSTLLTYTRLDDKEVLKEEKRTGCDNRETARHSVTRLLMDTRGGPTRL